MHHLEDLDVDETELRHVSSIRALDTQPSYDDFVLHSEKLSSIENGKESNYLRHYKASVLWSHSTHHIHEHSFHTELEEQRFLPIGSVQGA
jgi:hypothetical protein